MYKVELREYERGWGQRTDSIKVFPTKQKALKFIEDYNSKNTSETVPDWYMIAVPMFDDRVEPKLSKDEVRPKKKAKPTKTKEADNILDF